MAQIKLKNGTIIGDGYRPYIIAEMNSSHSGNVEEAKKMITEAKRIGCDCVKFQSWNEKSLYSSSYYEENKMTKRIIKKFALLPEQLGELSEFCRSIHIDFSSTPYSEQEVDFLAEECHVPFIKISSMEINNYAFLEYIAKKRLPVMLSTGMSTYEEIKKAIHTIIENGNEQIMVLHCVTKYPAEPDIINLNNIIALKEQWQDFPIGYSDHTMGMEVACAAVAMGANIIEKHFTLDRTKIGMDNQMATEPHEMEGLVIGCQNVFQALGTKERILSEGEWEQRKKMRRSVVALRDIKKGETILREDIGAKRPGTGIPADQMESLVGKTAAKDIKRDYMINQEDVILF